MKRLGLDRVGYRYINIDDGFFGGRAADGTLLIHPTRFPRGLGPVVRHIHSLGFKAGIYSNAGRNTLRLSNASTFLPPIDCLRVERVAR